MPDKRHLHRDYNTAECGLDASHILMTYDEKEATCSKCPDARKERLKREAAAERQKVAEVEAREKLARAEMERLEKEKEERLLSKLEARLKERAATSNASLRAETRARRH